MKKLKKVIPIITAFIIGLSTTVTAATVFNSKDVTYSSDKTEVTNVKDSLDELYSKIGKCPDGWYCHTVPTTIADNIELGDYISMTPTSTSYTISKDLTGYDKDQTINPSELNIWRVMKKNDDGTVDVISEYVTSKIIYFEGLIGYMNYVGTLNKIASQYINVNYVKETRNVGYYDQIEFCTDITEDTCPRQMGGFKDLNILRQVEGLVEAKIEGGSGWRYYLSDRSGPGTFLTTNCYINSLGKETGCGGLYKTTIEETSYEDARIRPILTLKEDIKIESGDGKSAETAYQLK